MMPYNNRYTLSVWREVKRKENKLAHTERLRAGRRWTGGRYKDYGNTNTKDRRDNSGIVRC